MNKLKAYIHSIRNDPTAFGMSLSILVALVMPIGKIFAYMLTHSQAILSDAAESIVHLAAMAIAGTSLWYSKQPADHNHKYGHGKIAYFSAAGEGIIILMAAFGIFYSATLALKQGVVLNELDTGLLILSFLGLTNYVLGTYLLKIGKKNNSLILKSNGKHILTDMWTSLGVVAGVLIVWLTGLSFLDPIIACFVAAQITFTSFGLLKTAFKGLMETTDPDYDKKLVTILEKYQTKGTFISYHNLKNRFVNDVFFVEVHLLFKEMMPLKDVHEKLNQLEIAIANAFPDYQVSVITHPEPENHEKCHPKGHPELTINL